MNRLVAITAIVALLVGVLAGYLGWGTRASRLQATLDEAQARVGQLEQQLGDLRGKTQQLEARLKTAEADLDREKEMNRRLERLVGAGKGS